MTFNEFARVFTTHIKKHLKKRSIEQYVYILNRTLIPEFGLSELTEIKRKSVAGLHLSLYATPVYANRVIAVGRTIFSYAYVWGILSDGNNPFRNIKLYREILRDRFLGPSEYRRVGRILDDFERNGTISRYGLAGVRTLILTGCRVSEIELLRWDDVELQDGYFRLPDSKTGPRVIEMPAGVQEIFGSLHNNGSEFVFPGRHGRIGLNKVWRKVRRKAGLEDVRLHDLRHSYATMAVGQGISMPVIARLLGHSTLWTTTRYVHSSRRQSSEAADLVCAAILRDSVCN